MFHRSSTRAAVPQRHLKSAVLLAAAPYLLSCAACTAAPGGGSTPAPSSAVAGAIGDLRGVHVGGEPAEKINERLDAAWRVLEGDKEAARVAVAQALRGEVAKKSPDNFFLLDTSAFLFRVDGDAYRDLVLQAMTKIDAADPVIGANAQELFDLSEAVAATKAAELMPILDSTFLSHDLTVFLAQHSMKLDSTVMSIFLYGPLGEPAEKHLVALLEKGHPASKRILGILSAIGSPEAGPAVARRLSRSKDPQEIGAAMLFLATLGGEQGKRKLLAYTPPADQADLAARVKQIQAAMAKRSKASCLSDIESKTGKGEKLPADVVRARLEAMAANDGPDDTTMPMSILRADVPAGELTGLLRKVRSATLLRVSDEALHDVSLINYMINTLAYD